MVELLLQLPKFLYDGIFFSGWHDERSQKVTCLSSEA